MKHPKLKLKAPKYQDEVVMELSGDYNDGDYTYSTISMSVDAYEIVLPILKKLEGSHEWEENNREDIGAETLEKLGIDEENSLYDEVMGALQDISLYSDSGGCHTMTIEAVYFESKSDNIRYEVKY